MKFASASRNLKYNELFSLLFLAITSVFLVGIEQKEIGWVLYAIGLGWHLITTNGGFKKHIALIYLSLGLLGLIPITTQTTNANFMLMGSVLGAALVAPFLITRYIYQDHVIRFKWHHGRRWLKSEVFYVLVTAVVAYFLLPFYLKDTGAYLNWGVDNTTESIARLFIGTNILGIWDELFFVSTVLGLLRRYLPFWQANMLQAILFTSFLYELGFTGWAPIVIYPFALSQGYVFKKTDSLLYVITIHLTLDFVLFLALLNAHHPELANVFLY